MSGFRSLKVWQIAHDLTLEVYRLTSRYPGEEKYGIVSQMRRAAYSVPSNIVEGKSRNTQKQFRQFLIIARASVDELAYFLLLSKDLDYINIQEYEPLNDKCSHVGSMLNNLIKKINDGL